MFVNKSIKVAFNTILHMTIRMVSVFLNYLYVLFPLLLNQGTLSW